ncbi:hypothetical protein WCN91_14540 [Pseudoalteromonas sp. YIC-827]|uniref:IPT/TIG domain-containing protein n=1 Tax=Pseudoalteromonas qingdaonensis TaxID=3131913 RepID=A0ABU9N218_9GAMM
MIEKGRYRFGDTITLIGDNFSALNDPVVVVYQHNNVFNFKPNSVSANQLTFNFDVPKGKYALFIYDADSKTAAPRVCVPANEVSALIGLLVATLIHPRVTAELCAQCSLTFDE